MGGAIARGLLSRPAHEVSPQQSARLSVAVSNPTAAKLEPLAAEGARVTLSNVEAVGAESDLVIICVKPWLVEQVINEIKPYIDYSRTEVAVVAAGIPLDKIAGWLVRHTDDSEYPLLPPIVSLCPTPQCRNVSQ